MPAEVVRKIDRNVKFNQHSQSWSFNFELVDFCIVIQHLSLKNIIKRQKDISEKLKTILKLILKSCCFMAKLIQNRPILQLVTCIKLLYH